MTRSVPLAELPWLSTPDLIGQHILAVESGDVAGWGQDRAQVIAAALADRAEQGDPAALAWLMS